MHEDKDYEQWMNKIEKDKLLILPENLKLFKEHLREVKRQYKLRTVINHIIVLLPFVKWCKKPIKELDKYDVGDYLDTLEDLADTSQTLHQMLIRKFLRAHIPEVAATIVVKKAEAKHTPDEMLNSDDLEKLIDAAPTARDRALIACLYESGARKSELLSTTITDAKFDRYGCLLWLRESKTKTRPARLIYASSYLYQWLQVHPRKGDKTAPIFCSFNEPYEVISRSGLYKHLNKIKKKSGVTKPTNPHQYRHSRATMLAKTLRSEQKMKALLGWKPSSAMTGRYIHLSALDIDNAALEAAGIKKEEEDGEEGLKVVKCLKCKEFMPTHEERCPICGYSEKDEIVDIEALRAELKEEIKTEMKRVIQAELQEIEQEAIKPVAEKQLQEAAHQQSLDKLRSFKNRLEVDKDFAKSFNDLLNNSQKR